MKPDPDFTWAASQQDRGGGGGYPGQQQGRGQGSFQGGRGGGRGGRGDDRRDGLVINDMIRRAPPTAAAIPAASLTGPCSMTQVAA